MEPNMPGEMAQTVCQFIRTALFLVKNGVAKSKLILQLLHDLTTTRGKTLLKGALPDVVLPSPASCRSRDDITASYISPRPLREYEFSCSNTPASNKYIKFTSRRRRRRPRVPPPAYNIVDRVNIYNINGGGGFFETASEASPLVGGGAAREVRISDSPFLETWDKEGYHVVDREAERFIQMFYRELRLQKLMAARDAPDPYG